MHNCHIVNIFEKEEKANKVLMNNGCHFKRALNLLVNSELVILSED